jgi:DNA-binding response OmpR family regulator
LPGYERVPILMMTGAATHRRQLAAERAGANEMLLKPFSMSHLSREIARLLGEPAPVEAGEATVKVWKSPPSLAWKFGEGSELSAGRRMLETLRPGGGRGI